jgi:hypothetical protein
MSTSQVEISKIEINPNRLHEALKTPLPDFAVSALIKNGFSEPQTTPHISNPQHNSVNGSARCKLDAHIRSINTYINSDGSRLWQSSATRDVRDSFDTEHP